MKKVYLVYASIFYQDGSRIVILLNVFASAIKAEVYANYKRLSIERDGASGVFGTGVQYADIRLDCEPICTVDWSYDLKALQDEMPADAKRNFGLINKSNLLEFV